MPSTLSVCGFIALAFIGFANAHMKMASPVPFDVANLDNSPLKPDGSDYPCKSCGYKISAMNKIPVNEPVLLSFDGSAIHGGGTCQVAISMDKAPTKDSTFKVIQTFEGDCPPAAGTGLTFNIPEDFPTVEQATLAWTWFNKIGNREMYMNLAPIEVTGGSDNQNFYESLPDLFVANIGNGITTPETEDPTMPNPGEFLIQASTYKPGEVTGHNAPAQNQNAQSAKVTNFAAYGPPTKDSNQVVPVDGGSGTDSGGSSQSAPATGGGGNDGMYNQPAASATQPSSAPTVGGNDGMYTQPVASSAQSSSIATSSAAPSATAPATSASSVPPSSFKTMTVPASSATAPAPAYPTLSPSLGQGVSGPSTGSATPSGAPSSSGSTGGSGQCTTDGAVVCNGPNQFGLCSHGSVGWQAVAAGTTCSNGVIQKRSSHVRRHAHGVHKVRAS